MPPPDLHPATIKLLDQMTGVSPGHPHFFGKPIDITQIDALALGDLWAVAHATDRRESRHEAQSQAGETARSILNLARDREPAFRGAACRDYLDLLAREAEEDGDAKDTFKMRSSWLWKRACFALIRCVDPSFEGLGRSAARFLAAADWRTMPHLAVALARLVDPASETRVLEKLAVHFVDSPLLVAELRAAAGLDLPANILVADVVEIRPVELAAAAHHRLSDLPFYAAFAETGLKQAAERMRAIHNFELPYASDKAFTLEESAVIARLTRVALDRDESWVPPVLEELFLKVSLAPTAAKTVPSQSVAIALGHAIEAFPTPEALAILRNVLRNLRHAGVEKKLQRNVRGAERGLAGRLPIALRVSQNQSLTKSQLTTLKRSLEASLGMAVTLGYEDWRARLAGHASAKGLAGSLVWRILGETCGGVAVLPVMDRCELQLQDVNGKPVTAGSECRVTLWHPSDATAEERIGWRDRLTALQMRQPFKQVFREHYIVPADELSHAGTAMFANHAVSIRPFLGLARREGWRIDDDYGLVRTIGDRMATLGLADHVYPGAEGWTTTGKFSVRTIVGQKRMPARLSDMPAAAVSEALRSVDLLVSTSGFAISAGSETSDEDPHRQIHLQRLAARPLGPMGEMRAEALARVLRDWDGMAGLRFDARHLRLGPYAIHLATGRTTRDGEPVTIDTPGPANLAAVPWLPYDEKLLETILYTALELARRCES